MPRGPYTCGREKERMNEWTREQIDTRARVWIYTGRDTKVRPPEGSVARAEVRAGARAEVRAGARAEVGDRVRARGTARSRGKLGARGSGVLILDREDLGTAVDVRGEHLLLRNGV